MQNVDIKVIRHEYKSDPASVAYDAIEHAKARGINVVLVDTAGRRVSAPLCHRYGYEGLRI